MRPPNCYLCHQDFSASSGKLVCFVLTDAGARWEERMAAGGTGHHPDHGWFCPEHMAAARALAPTHTLRNALNELNSEPISPHDA